MFFLSWHVSLGFAGTSPHRGLRKDDSLEEHGINVLLLPFPPPGLFSLTEKAKNLCNSQNHGMVWVDRALNLITTSIAPIQCGLEHLLSFFFSNFILFFLHTEKLPGVRSKGEIPSMKS